MKGEAKGAGGLTLTPGSKLGPYEILSAIGSGAFTSAILDI